MTLIKLLKFLLQKNQSGKLVSENKRTINFNHIFDKFLLFLKHQHLHFTGTAVGYHGFTIGMYMDQLVRRVDPKHRNLATFFREEIAKPLGEVLQP